MFVDVFRKCMCPCVCREHNNGTTHLTKYRNKNIYTGKILNYIFEQVISNEKVYHHPVFHWEVLPPGYFIVIYHQNKVLLGYFSLTITSEIGNNSHNYYIYVSQCATLATLPCTVQWWTLLLLLLLLLHTTEYK